MVDVGSIGPSEAQVRKTIDAAPPKPNVAPKAAQVPSVSRVEQAPVSSERGAGDQGISASTSSPGVEAASGGAPIAQVERAAAAFVESAPPVDSSPQVESAPQPRPSNARIVGDINADLTLINADLAIEVDHDLNQVIFKVVDLETGETIKQIPSEELIKIAKRIKFMLENYSQVNNSSGVLMGPGSFA
jgi:flagellar protein FlaG